MAKIKRDPKRREAIQKFIELYQPESVDDIYESLKTCSEKPSNRCLKQNLKIRLYIKERKTRGYK